MKGALFPPEVLSLHSLSFKIYILNQKCDHCGNFWKRLEETEQSVCFTINAARLFFLSFSRRVFISTFFSFQKWHRVVALATYHEHFPMSVNHLIHNHFLRSAEYVITKLYHNLITCKWFFKTSVIISNTTINVLLKTIWAQSWVFSWMKNSDAGQRD